MTETDLLKLRERLPKQHTALIKNALLEKGITVSEVTIWKALRFPGFSTEKHQAVIKAAIEIAEQFEKDRELTALAARGEEKLDKLKFNLQEK